jgi:hypothetical protein
MIGEIKKEQTCRIVLNLSERQYDTLIAGIKMARDKILGSGLDMENEDQELFNLFLNEEK